MRDTGPPDGGKYDLDVPSKAVERAVLQECARSVPAFPQAKAADHESPDFLVRINSRTVGIEMQEFIQGAGPTGAGAREAETTRDATMRMAQQQFEASHPTTHLYVYGHFRPDTLSRRLAPKLAARVAALVATLIPAIEPGKMITRTCASYNELEAAGLAEYMLDLDISLFVKATYGLWVSPEAGMASRDLEDLERQIHTKEAKVDIYRRNCDEIWLVIYALMLPSGAFDMEALAGARVTSLFDHVVFIDVVSGRHALLAG